jgi:hypothetical protein
MCEDAAGAVDAFGTQHLISIFPAEVKSRAEISYIHHLEGSDDPTSLDPVCVTDLRCERSGVQFLREDLHALVGCGTG